MAEAAGNSSEQAARESPPTAARARQPLVATLDLPVFMAARRGDSRQLKDLLQLEEEEQGTSRESVVVQVDPPDAVLLWLPKDDGVTIDGDSVLHVVAGCGGSQEFLRCAKMIVRNKEKKGGAAAKRLVLEARNSNGQTPLHCAAGAGNGDMISCLADLATGSSDEDDPATKAFVRLQDKSGETALHQAVVHAAGNKLMCVSILMAIDPDLACITGEDGASPLFLAISSGEMEIARHLFYTAQGNLSYSGPSGGNVLHAAVYRPQALSVVLEWLRSLNNPIRAADHLSKLTRQTDKQQGGSTPLHLAVSSDWWDWNPVQGFLSGRFPHIWPASNSTAALLLDANISIVYQTDDYGLYPIHVAAKYGRLGVVKMLLQRCPDCATLRDSNGRTFLHHAAYAGSHSVVKHVCQTPHLITILNVQDSKGDTALHRGIRSGSVSTFKYLFRNLQVRLDVANNDGMTPLDLSCSMLQSGFQYSYNPRSVVWMSLLHEGAPYGGGRPECSRGKHTPTRDLALESNQLARKAQLMSVVTVLIATVTFAAAFTLPGGYRADGKGGSRKHLNAAGTAVLARTYYLDTFILADALAFICSIMATSTLAYVGMPSLDINVRNCCYTISCRLLRSSAVCLVCAFCAALLAALAPVDPWAALCVTFLIIITYYGTSTIEFWTFTFSAPRAISRNNGSLYVPGSRRAREILIFVWPVLVIVFIPMIWDEDMSK